MKKSWLALLAAPVIAYPAAAWYFGSQVESTLASQYRQVEALPYARIVERTYEGGVFSARESITIELFGDLTRALQDAAADAPGDTPAEPLRIRLSSRIQHGPFIGGAFAAAVVDSELVLDADTKTELAPLFGDNKPLTARTVFRVDGGGRATVLSPAFSSRFASPESGEAVDVAWEGVAAELDFAPDMSHYTVRGAAPRLEIKGDDGTHMVMTGMRFDGEQQRMFDDEPLLFSGKQRFTIDEIHMTGAGGPTERAALKRISYDVDMPAEGDFIDMVARMGAEVVDIGGSNYGPAHFDLSFRHLHARTVARLYRALLEAESNPAMTGPDADPQMALASLAQPAMELLGHDPSFRLDRLSFTTPNGDAHLDLRASVPGIAPEAIANPGLLMAALDAGANIALPETLLLGIGKERARAQIAAMSETGTVSDEDMRMVVAQLEGTLRQLGERGFVTRDGGLVKSTASFKAGQFTVNGRPFNPMAMQ